MLNLIDNNWSVENDKPFPSKRSKAVSNYMQFVVVKDDVEIDISVRLQDKFVFHTVSKITGRSAKKNKL